MGTNKKFFGWKISPNNFSPKMEKTGIVSEKILGWEIGMKNSSRKIGKKIRIVSEKILRQNCRENFYSENGWNKLE